jgi:hypothetical protein
MITGYDLINKYYEDEKLYSTGDDYLDDLLEKAFCEGYEYAQREFAEESDKDVKLNKEDERDIRRWSRHKETADLKRKALEGDKEARKALGKKGYKLGMAVEGSLGALGGAAVGATASGKNKLRNAAIGALIGGAAGTGVGALVGKEIKDSWSHDEKYDKRNSQATKDRELEHDKLAVATNKMSRKKFLKKWGK